MAPILRNSLLAAAASAAICIAVITPASAATFDLKTDWSDVSNPAGPWSYRENNTLLIQHPNWSGFGPAWSNSASGVPTPMLLQYDGVGSESIDALLGDIVGHTATSGSALNIRFTSNIAGAANISGNIWDAHITQDRDQLWGVFVNNVLQASGVVLGDGTNGRSAPDTFSFFALLAVNDSVELRATKEATETFGGLTGFDMIVDITPTAPPSTGVPEPSTVLLVLCGLLVIAGAGLPQRKS